MNLLNDLALFAWAQDEGESKAPVEHLADRRDVAKLARLTADAIAELRSQRTSFAADAWDAAVIVHLGEARALEVLREAVSPWRWLTRYLLARRIGQERWLAEVAQRAAESAHARSQAQAQAQGALAQAQHPPGHVTGARS